LPIEYVARRNGLINALTLDNVRRAAQRLFNPARLVIVVAGAAPVAKKSVKPGKTAKPR
jgi:zinc protease